MLNMVMSAAASGLLRALLDRAGDQRNRILLSDIHSVDWQSLTLAGERHLVTLRIPGPDAERMVAAFILGIEDAEFAIPGTSSPTSPWPATRLGRSICRSLWKSRR